MIAEEVAKVNPLFATYQKGRVQGVKYPQLTAVLINAIKQQQAEIRSQQATIQTELRLTRLQGAQIVHLKNRLASQAAEVRQLRRTMLASLSQNPTRTAAK